MFPTEGDRVCSWLLWWSPTNRDLCAVALLQKGPSVPRKLGLTTAALSAMGRQKGTCRVDVAQQVSRINHHLFPSAHIIPHPATSQQPAAFLATAIPMAACSEKYTLWERRRKTVRGELSVCKRKVFSSKALRRSVLLLSGQAESTLSHYHRRERGSRCLTRLRQSQHTDANTFTRISWAAALMQPDSRATSARVAAIDRLSLLVLSAAAFYFLFKVSSSPSARCC